MIDAEPEPTRRELTLDEFTRLVMIRRRVAAGLPSRVDDVRFALDLIRRAYLVEEQPRPVAATGVGVELREWLDNLLTVVDGIADDVRYLAVQTNHEAEDLSCRTVSHELTDLQRRLYQLPLEEEP